jgi:hypothetical protein
MLQDARLRSMLDERRQHHRNGKKDDHADAGQDRPGRGYLQQQRGRHRTERDSEELSRGQTPE